MSRNSRVIGGASAQDVFDVLRDGWTYSSWVVGTRMIRHVEPGWPRAGTAIHYTVGWWPFRKDDETRSLDYDPDRSLHLEARAWPAGTAGIHLSAEETEDGVVVHLAEAPARGVLRLLHNPLVDAVLALRNVETLRRLEAAVRRKQATPTRAASG